MAIHSRWAAEPSNWFVGALAFAILAALVATMVWVRPILGQALGIHWLLSVALALVIWFVLAGCIAFAFLIPAQRRAGAALRGLLASGARVPEILAALVSLRSPAAGPLMARVRALRRDDPQARIDCDYALRFLGASPPPSAFDRSASPEVVAAVQALRAPAAATPGRAPSPAGLDAAIAAAGSSLGKATLAILARLEEATQRGLDTAEAQAVESQLRTHESTLESGTLPAGDVRAARDRIAAIRARLAAVPSAGRTAEPGVVETLTRVMATVPDEYGRRPFVMAIHYIRAVEFLDSCGEFTLEKLRRAYEIAGVAGPDTDAETESLWRRAGLVLSSAAAGRGPGEPGGTEFLRFDLRRVYREGISNAAPHCGAASGAVRDWLSSASAGRTGRDS